MPVDLLRERRGVTSQQWTVPAQKGRISVLLVAPPLPVELTRCIERCASALNDLPRLKSEVKALKENGSASASFAAALFELELARKGDTESRLGITQLAEVLLVFWREGTGEDHSNLHPALQPLWHSVAPMLRQFEARRFELALVSCWKKRSEPEELTKAIETLVSPNDQRGEFARCLYHLELARQGVDSSRVEFARRAGLLAEAYQSPAFAHQLVGQDPGLKHLWSELTPYLDEFFETLEEQAARAQAASKQEVLGESASDTVKFPVALGDGPAIPSFRTLVASKPSDATPPGAWVPDADVFEEASPASARPPPPPLNLTPPGAWRPPRTPSGEVEIVEVDYEIPPPPPPMTPAHGTAPADDDVPLEMEAEVLSVIDVDQNADPDEATLAFWDYTFSSLQEPPADNQKPRMLATESRSERKRLTTWLGGLGQHLAVPEARAFAALVRLLLAGETKQKSLFGQPNPRRKTALESAFALLSPTPEAAGRAAVWFELDGPETREALNRGLALLTEFLAYCARNELDPLDAQVVEKYLEN